MLKVVTVEEMADRREPGSFVGNEDIWLMDDDSLKVYTLLDGKVMAKQQSGYLFII